MMNRRLFQVALATLALALLVTACAPTAPPPPTARPTSPPAPTDTPVPPTPTPVPPTATPTTVPPTPTEAAPTDTPVPPSQPELPKGPEAEWNLVVIGDSSLWGLGEAFASQIEKDVGVKVILEDVTLGGLSAGRVLQALQTGKSLDLQLQRLPDTLRDAEVVVMFVNPLSSVDPEKPLDFGGCFLYRAPESCSPESFEKYIADMKAIWAKILELRAGQPTILRATDIYNPLVSPWNEHDVFEACTVCWGNMSNAARLAAEAYDIPFLSRYDAFNGANHNEDPREKGYIRSDGEHPSDLASQYTAKLLSQMGYEPVSPP